MVCDSLTAPLDWFLVLITVRHLWKVLAVTPEGYALWCDRLCRPYARLLCWESEQAQSVRIRMHLT